ncbi:MAG: histidinol dehydrogenase [Veillonellaceae bacterium]|nr:histidinol dehydrogenase [Veillonellaceae bacterium]
MKIYKDKSLEDMKKIVSDYTADTSDRVIEERVATIIKTVRDKGDQALKEYSQQFDKVTIDDFKVDKETIEAAYKKVDPAVIKALEVAKANITSFHEQEKERGFMDASKPGVLRGQKVTPLARVGIYVPGGTAAYPSTIMMCALPAKIAGVKDIIMVTPPQVNGIAPAVLAAAKIAGVTQIYQVGGAQAVAALAYGTESIPRVDKIVGPGNIYVATAKKQVFGQVSIDMVAGPSEIGIVADQSADPVDLAADLLSQAEHDKRARAILITNNQSLAQAVSQEVDRQLAVLPRKDIAGAAIADRSFIAVMPSIQDMFALMNEVAPEHLEVQLDNPIQYLSMIENAGSVFLGKYASEPLGDYAAGPNHVLPTGGTARFSSALGVYDFVKHTSFSYFTKDTLAELTPHVTALARVEGLEAHARAVESRFRK